MSEHIICATIAEAEELEGKIHAWKLANVPGYNAMRWSLPIPHPTETGKFSVPLKNGVKGGLSKSDALRVAERDATWTPDVVKSPTTEKLK